MDGRRRKFVLAAGAATVATGLAGGFWWRHRPSIHDDPDLSLPYDASFPNPLRVPGGEGLMGVIDVPASLTLIAKQLHPPASLSEGVLLAYESEHQTRHYFNPVLRGRSGATVGIKFWNALDETSIIHWHGFKVDSNNDGHPHYAVPAGATYDYHFMIANRAGTYWYHPHPHHRTARQTALGLAGIFIVEDDEEWQLQQALDLKFGETDIPLLIQDRRLNAEGRPLYTPDADERSHGYFGGEVLVNFTKRPHLAAAMRIYRFRIINGSNARIYRLAFVHETEAVPYHIIGNDGGLLERPYIVKEAFLSPAERLDVLLDLRTLAPGNAVKLVSLPFEPMHLEREQGGRKHPAALHAEHGTSEAAHGRLSDGAAIELLKIAVVRKRTYNATVPESLSAISPLDITGAKRRVLNLSLVKGHWRINGLSYDERATPIVVKRGSVEIWEVRNPAQSMPHPMHVHGFQFQLLERQETPEQQRRTAVNEQGLSAADLGWKDTVLIWPGETVRFAIDFSHSFLGDQVYMVHCHNLEHEDGGMMLNFKVAA